MPYDSGYDDEDKKGGSDEGSTRRFKDFDCPECAANNPYDDGFGPGDEVRCFYCGLEFRVELSGEGKWKYREL